MGTFLLHSSDGLCRGAVPCVLCVVSLCAGTKNSGGALDFDSFGADSRDFVPDSDEALFSQSTAIHLYTRKPVGKNYGKI